MLLHFVLLVRAANISEPSYSLVYPYRFTNVSEIGHWTLRGAAFNAKSFIRLTPSQPNQYGAICNRVPTDFMDWTVDIEVNAFGGTGGRGYWFTFSEDLCVFPRRGFRGFTVRMPTHKPDHAWDSWFPVFVGYSNTTKDDGEGLCSIGTRSDTGHLDLRIERTGEKVALSYRTLDPSWEDGQFYSCGEVTVKDLPDFGYFSFSAMTNSSANDDHDFFGLRAQSRTAKVPSSTDFSTINRKILEGRQHHGLRKSGKMPLTKRYLAGEDVPTFSDSLRLVNETVWRAQQTETKVRLQQFINSSLITKIEEAQAHLLFANSSLDDVRKVLDDVWKGFGTELTALQSDVKEQMEITWKDIEKSAQALFANQMKLAEQSEREAETTFANTDEELTDPMTPLLMLLFCFVEALGFGAFFTKRLRKLRTAKKTE
jgi:hypothetical protein